MRISIIILALLLAGILVPLISLAPHQEANAQTSNSVKVVQTSNTVVQFNSTTQYNYKTSAGTYSFNKAYPFILNYTGILTSVSVPFSTFGVNQSNTILIPCLSSTLCTLKAHVKPYVYSVVYDILSGVTKVGTLNVTYNFQRSIPPKITVTFTTSATNYNIFWLAAGYKVNNTLTSSMTKTVVGTGIKVILLTSSTDNLGVILNWGDYGNAKVIAWQSNFFGLATYSATLIVFGINVNAVDPTLVQSNTGSCSSCTSVSVSFSSAVTSGDLLVVAFQGHGTPSNPIFSVSDSLSNSWTNVGTSPTVLSGSAYYLAGIFYSISSSTGSDTVTVTSSGSEALITIEIFEVSGLGSSVNVISSTGSGTSGTSLSTNSVSFTSGSFLIASINAYSTLTAGTGFTLYTIPSYPSRGSEYATSGITSPTNFPATQSSSGFWTEIGAAFNPIVTQPINIPTPAGGSAFTYTVSGCSVSPTSGTSGTTTNFQANPSCTLTISMPAAGTNTRYVFSGGAISTTVTTCSSGTCATFQPADYYQVYNTFSANPVNHAWDSAYTISVSGTQAGASATLCSITTTSGSGSSASCSAWSDYNTQATLSNNFNSVANTRWLASSTSFTPTSGGNTFTVNYYLQYLLSNPQSLQLTFTYLGNANTAKTNSWFDASTSVNIAGTLFPSQTSPIFAYSPCLGFILVTNTSVSSLVCSGNYITYQASKVLNQLYVPLPYQILSWSDNGTNLLSKASQQSADNGAIWTLAGSSSWQIYFTSGSGSGGPSGGQGGSLPPSTSSTTSQNQLPQVPQVAQSDFSLLLFVIAILLIIVYAYSYIEKQKSPITKAKKRLKPWI